MSDKVKPMQWVKPLEEKPLTKWECGNELVRISDEISKNIDDLNHFPELQSEIRKARKVIASAFKKHGMEEELGFGI